MSHRTVWPPFGAVDGELVAAAANVVAGEKLRLDWDVRELAASALALIDCVLRPLHRAQQEEEVDFDVSRPQIRTSETRQKGRQMDGPEKPQSATNFCVSSAPASRTHALPIGNPHSSPAQPKFARLPPS